LILFQLNKPNLGRCGNLVRGLRIEHAFTGKNFKPELQNNFKLPL